jgi:hypothetical protein
MAIKSASEIAEHNFRSLEEMEDVLQEVEQDVNDLGQLVDQYERKFARAAAVAAPTEFKIVTQPTGKRLQMKKGSPLPSLKSWPKVAIPNLSQLKSNFTVVDELYDKLEVLQTLEGSLTANFKARHGAGKVLAGITRLRKVTESKIAKALRFLQNLATKHVPEPFTGLIDDTLQEVSVKVNYADYETFLYVHENEGGNFQFTAYIRLLSVQDEEGRAYPDLYLVFTCELRPNPANKKEVSLTYYVTVLHSFATPGKFSLGTEVDSVRGAVMVLGTQLELENFSNSLGVLPLPIDKKLTKDAFSVKDKIHSLEVDDSAMTFVLKSVVKTSEVNAIREQLYVEIRAMLFRFKAKLKMRQFKSESGKTAIQFTFTNLADSSQVSLNDLDFLKTRLGLDDDKLRRVVKIINGH